jgi:hypothetical protein
MEAAIEYAISKWEKVIKCGLPDKGPITIEANVCGNPSALTTLSIDDLHILVDVDNIDGENKVLARAGYCYRRAGDGGLPFLGHVQIDNADLPSMIEDGQLKSVIAHEFGHILGFGPGADCSGGYTCIKDCIHDASTETYKQGTYWGCPNAIDGFNAVGGDGYTGGMKVPFANEGGKGTINAHWRESVFDTELMTGYAESGKTSAPLSIVTVCALHDLGYGMNFDAADPYEIPTCSPNCPAVQGSASKRVHIEDDVRYFDVKVV